MDAKFESKPGSFSSTSSGEKEVMREEEILDKVSISANSARIKFNRKVLQSFQSAFEKNPECDFLALIPVDYRYQILGKAAIMKPEYLKLYEPVRQRSGRPGRPDNRAKLVSTAVKASIIHPLSECTISMLAGYLEPETLIQDPLQNLVPVLTRMIAKSEKLWEGDTRGLVLKCTEHLAVKIVRGSDSQSHTEYASLVYLNSHAPDLPIPKPHGFIKLDSYCLIFMTYFPSTSLEKIWPSLCHENKAKIQGQLDSIFTRLRKLDKTCPINPDSNANDQVLTQEHLLFPEVDEFGEPVRLPGDTRLSVSRLATTSWIKCLQGFLPTVSTKRIFTHGDLWMGNIIVDLDHKAEYSVSGIIDWETSGFYPEHFEASRILGGFNLGSDSDWFKYLPDSVSPQNYPVHWLVQRLWQTTVNLS